MTTEAYLILASDGSNTGKKVDCGPGPLTDGAGNVVYRQAGLIGDPTNIAAVAAVKPGGTLATSADGAVVITSRESAKPVGSGSVNAGQSAVTTSAASALVPARTGALGTGRISTIVKNIGAIAIYIGNAGVTTGTGFLLNAGESVTWDTTAAVYGVTAAGSGLICYSETY